MSGSSIASVAATSAAVPAGAEDGQGLGANDMAHRMVKMSLRSVMWSLCRWVRNRALNAGPAPTRTAAARIRTPRPQSNSKSPAAVRTRVDGPARCGIGERAATARG
jgi:hypothetical protein